MANATVTVNCWVNRLNTVTWTTKISSYLENLATTWAYNLPTRSLSCWTTGDIRSFP